MFKFMFKFFIDDLLNVINCILKLLTKQYKNYNIKLIRIKIHIIYNMSRNFMSKLIDNVFSHVLKKIRTQ